ncbi:uncharacterized protein K452DRAFT_316081 [Aplosporella prunicola CBS 121167]|uniref:Protein arginine methyltransferase NDUFAF7 n=1 Tax=Aplosporella prunicola CBS 121167 TaxID=1176127 RepID=A0A6A6BQ43_9PEZI|nr:uncharacterized protein K452DRAFT_316081 [Aplosporella prunicola CBS 121167]KAF2144937.1 hypothetical protein K452DRAFT_316081 [Aplosporella prunicola CBS 121167]
MRACVRLLYRPDRAGWKKPTLPKPPITGRAAVLKANNEPPPAKQWSTPLAQHLTRVINTTGPVSVAAYMRQCLTSESGGYYTRQTKAGGDQFGQKGDFVTSPEISQIFGELVGLWVVAEWIAQGRKREGVQLIEAGPGRGTLMDDMLRTIRNFKALENAIETIFMVEASQSLRKSQHKLLCGDAPLKKNEIGFESKSKYSNTRIVWVEDIRFVEKDPSKTPFIIAHEFFDALPIHIFESVAPTSEKEAAQPSVADPNEKALPDLDEPEPIIEALKQQRERFSKQHDWREFVVSPAPPRSTHQSLNTPEVLRFTSAVPEFQLTLSKAPTPHSLYLPLTSPRYKALQGTPGAVIEISPESRAIAADFAVRIGGAPAPAPPASSTDKDAAPTPPPSSVDDAPSTKPNPSGAALILDYGPADTIPCNTLRGIRAHRAVSPFSSAGAVDLSADVDFLALAEAALDASPGVEVHGPVEQARFLGLMGVRERAEMLVRKAEKAGVAAAGDWARDEAREVKERIEGGWRRLVATGPNGMGRLYKALAIVPYVPEKPGRRPVGFGGDVSV